MMQNAKPQYFERYLNRGTLMYDGIMLLFGISLWNITRFRLEMRLLSTLVFRNNQGHKDFAENQCDRLHLQEEPVILFALICLCLTF